MSATSNTSVAPFMQPVTKKTRYMCAREHAENKGTCRESLLMQVLTSQLDLSSARP